MPTQTIKRGTTLRKRRSGVYRDVVGFTTKPDGIKRVRLTDGERETRVRVDQLTKTYETTPYQFYATVVPHNQ